MEFLIEHQYVVLYFSGAFFSFFAMLSYIKINKNYIGRQQKLESPEDFFNDFDNTDLEALLEESVDEEEISELKHSGSNAEVIPFSSGHLNIEDAAVSPEQTDSLEESASKGE